jgi:uncharacterized membrane protein
MLVSLPIALYVLTLGGLIGAAAIDDPFWLRAAAITNGLALVTAVAAAIPGLVDLVLVVPRGEPRRRGTLHAALSSIALVCFAICFAIGELAGADGLIARIVLAVAGVGATVAAGFHGWTLVQRHHVGIDPIVIGAAEMSAGGLHEYVSREPESDWAGRGHDDDDQPRRAVPTNRSP